MWSSVGCWLLVLELELKQEQQQEQEQEQELKEVVGEGLAHCNQGRASGRYALSALAAGRMQERRRRRSAPLCYVAGQGWHSVVWTRRHYQTGPPARCRGTTLTR